MTMPINPRRTPESQEPNRSGVSPKHAVKKVAIVDGKPGVLGMIEGVLEAGHYDVVFIESVAHAYSHIKRLQPNLAVLCIRLADPEGFRVLSMLKLDEGTRQIPVLTYTAEYEGPEGVDQTEEEDEDDQTTMAGFLQPMSGVRMN